MDVDAGQECDAAAGDDALFDGRAGGVQGVLDAGLLLLHLRLGRGTDVDLGHATGQLREALLELLGVVVRLGVLDLGADLGDAALDLGLLARAFDDRRASLVTITFLALPRSLTVSRLSRVHAGGLHDGFAPVRIAMSSIMALRRSPKPGALTATQGNEPRRRLTTRVAGPRPRCPRR